MTWIRHVTVFSDSMGEVKWQDAQLNVDCIRSLYALDYDIILAKLVYLILKISCETLVPILLNSALK
jgi:hypothetical protein